MRYHFFLHYGWFFQNLGKEGRRTFMHTTVVLWIYNFDLDLALKLLHCTMIQFHQFLELKIFLCNIDNFSGTLFSVKVQLVDYFFGGLNLIFGLIFCILIQLYPHSILRASEMYFEFQSGYKGYF